MSEVRAKQYISKTYTTDDFSDGFTTIEDKLKVFADRVRGWQLEVAAQLIADNPHAGFGVLHIVTSYFEMIGMYLMGPASSTGKRKRAARQVEFGTPITRPCEILASDLPTPPHVARPFP